MLKYVLTAVLAGSAFGVTTTAPTTMPDTRMKSPAEEVKMIQLEKGYHLELVTSEPEIISPVLCTWDGDGRMYVAEMRSYMLDIDGRNSHTPMSRVSRWESTKGDGVYDKHTVFADKLMLPRMVLPLDERVLIRVTDTKDIVSYKDKDGDGVADEVTRVYEGGVQEGNLEHQPSGLLWDVDNWMYLTHQPERFRFTRGKMEKENYKLDTGQWGLAMRDDGGLIYATAGAENPAHHFQFMPQYGDISLPGEVKEGFYEVWPLEHMSDVQGGPTRLRPEGGLNRFTGCAGMSVYRGDALPADLYGDYILPEPVGRLIRRAKVQDVNGEIVISNPTPGKEWIASTDANFRPVWSATGPDGCLYICDMYHGIIQEANWTKEGSYLRPQIQKYGLDKNINGGRIWKLVHDGQTPRKMPRMLEETPAELMKHLGDPNGWWRDTAQKLIILRGDKSVVPALKEMAMNGSNAYARLHALWTLEGLDAADGEMVIAKLKDADSRIRMAAVRVAEPLLRKKESGVLKAVRAAAFDPDPRVAAQVCLTMFYLKDPTADFVVNRALVEGKRKEAETKTIAEVVARVRANLEKEKLDEEKKRQIGMTDPKLAAVFEKGRTYYTQMCISCHGANGLGANTPDGKSKLAPPLKGSERLQGQTDLVATIVLNGLTGVNNGKTYPEQMPNFRWADDERLSTVLTYARNEWGNAAGQIEPTAIAPKRAAAVARNKPFLAEELPAAVVNLKAKRLVLSAQVADIHGNEVVLEHLPNGVDAVGFGMNRGGSVSWRGNAPEPGMYEVKVACEAFGPGEFEVKVGPKVMMGKFVGMGEGEVDVGAVSASGEITVEFKPAGERKMWSPVNVNAIVLEQLD